jgi:hypothetical protein
LQTQPQKTTIQIDDRDPYSTVQTQPGLHLSWMTRPVIIDGQKTVTYPLGTGAAWARPIKLTRVYVSAPEGMDFSVQYPKIGAAHSGYERISGARIFDYLDTPSYSVDEASDGEGHIWRAVYLQSNPTENVVITVNPESIFSDFQRGLGSHIYGYTLLFAVIAGIGTWLLAWQYILPLFFRKNPNFARIKWYHALLYPAVNLLFMVIPGGILLLFFMMGLPGPALIGQFVVSAGVSIGLFMLMHSKDMGAGRGKALGAFILTSLCSSVVYLALAAGFAWVAGVI